MANVNMLSAMWTTLRWKNGDGDQPVWLLVGERGDHGVADDDRCLAESAQHEDEDVEADHATTTGVRRAAPNWPTVPGEDPGRGCRIRPDRLSPGRVRELPRPGPVPSWASSSGSRALIGSSSASLDRGAADLRSRRRHRSAPVRGGCVRWRAAGRSGHRRVGRRGGGRTRRPRRNGLCGIRTSAPVAGSATPSWAQAICHKRSARAMSESEACDGSARAWAWATRSTSLRSDPTPSFKLWLRAPVSAQGWRGSVEGGGDSRWPHLRGGQL